MSELELPALLLESVQDDDDADLIARGFATVGRRTWIGHLPGTIDELSARWTLTVGRPFQPGGVASWVAKARNDNGDHLVLKVGWRHEEALHEADALRVWNGNGAVRLVDSVTTTDTCALLIEECDPGTALSAALPPLQRDEVISELLQRLWIEPAAPHPFRPLSSMCDLWADEFDLKLQDAPSHGLDPGITAAGIELLRTLPSTAARHVLLCTDLHAGNIRAAAREPWLAIDPNPYLGDPAYDPIQYMLDASDRLTADPESFVGRMAALLDLDRDRLRLWLFARCVQESLDSPELIAVAEQLAP